MIFRRFEPPAELRPRPAGGPLVVRWLGCAGFSFICGGKTLLVDPFATRCSLPHAATRPLVPDRAAIDRHLPRADYVVCGHSHYDHLLDAPSVALRDGAVLVGSVTTCLVAKAAGVPLERLREVPPGGARLALGPFTVTLVPSEHGRWAFGRMLFPGCLSAQPSLPLRASGYPDGGVFGVHVEAAGAAVLHNGSAGVPRGLSELRADAVLACLAGRRFTENYLARIAESVRARAVVATHFDNFFAPLERALTALPGVGLETFAADVRAETRAAAVIPAFGDVVFPLHGG